MKLLDLLLIISIFTTSFDIFGVINFLGFNFRLTQFVLFPLFFICFFSYVKTKTITRFTGDKWLVLWTLVQFLLIPKSPHFKNALAYALWLTFEVIMIYVVLKRSRSIGLIKLLKLYFDSFILMACIGLFQFGLGLFGINFYTAQWWKYGKLARINGFSYEPSYYATYMLMGFVIFSYFFNRNNHILFSRLKTSIGLLLIGTALLLSSSRMGIAFAVLWFFFDLFRLNYKKLINGYSKKSFVLFSILISILLSVSLTIVFSHGVRKYKFLLRGTGIGKTANHSVAIRGFAALKTFEVFAKHPLIGVSLGGIDPSIARSMGIKYTTSKNGLSLSIFLEALAASGVIGIIPFIMFFITIYKNSKELSQKLPWNYADIIKAIFWALVFELAILQLSPTILRQYLWMHIAILIACINNFKATILALTR